MPAAGQWQSAGVLNVPQLSYSFLAATPTGDLLAATFNTGNVGSPPTEIPAVLIRNPTSPEPQVVELLRVAFDGQRGFGGVACDAQGNIYLSGDTGDGNTCFVKKFKPDGSPDIAFGQNGEIRPARRCLGVDLFGDFLVVAVDWCRFQVYRASTGQMISESAKGADNTYLRDVAIDPISLRILGVAAGSVVGWESGTPWEPTGYRYRTITPEAGTVRSGEGISLDPIKRQAIISPVPGNTVLEVGNDGNVARTVVATAEPTGHLADTVVSFDGTTLFVSDINGRRIHVLKRGAPGTSSPVPTHPVADAGTGAKPPRRGIPAAAASPTPSPLPPAQPAAPVTWHRSYQEVVEQARREGRPMIVYFRMNGVPRCEEVESSLLLTPEFNRRAQKFVCVFEDIAFNRLLAYRFGVFRVPHIVVLNRNADVMATFTFNVDPATLFNEMSRAQ